MQFTEITFNKESNNLQIKMNENVDFSIHDIVLINPTIKHLYLKISYTSHFQDLAATRIFHLVDYFKKDGYPLIDNDNNPIYIRTIKNSIIEIHCGSTIKDDPFDFKLNYMFK